MRRETILGIWIGGAVLAVALYLVGPERFLDACLGLIDAIDDAVHEIAFGMGARAYGIVRAAAIAIYVVFAVLALLSSQRGRRGFGALILVSLVLAFLVWSPFGSGHASFGRWLAALLLVTAGAVAMTQRLTAPPAGYPPGPPPSYRGRP